MRSARLATSETSHVLINGQLESSLLPPKSRRRKCAAGEYFRGSGLLERRSWMTRGTSRRCQLALDRHSQCGSTPLSWKRSGTVYKLLHNLEQSIEMTM